jgi:DNA-directed RNA polymerase III subunit RPC8
MFVLVELRDTVTIAPSQFNQKLHDAVTYALNKKFANKVIHKVGLCIALWDIVKMEDSYIFPLDGSSHTVVHFRFIVFRPFIDEVLVGTLTGSSSEGVHVSLGFFDDIFIPSERLKDPSRFDESSQQWMWIYENADDETQTEMRMEQGEQIRFRVCEGEFVDLTPNKPDKVSTDATLAAVVDSNKKVPYTVHGDIRDPGLGMIVWWS